MKDYSANYFNDISQKEQVDTKLIKFNPIDLGSIVLFICILAGIGMLLFNLPKMLIQPPNIVFVEGNQTIPKQDLLTQLAITEDQKWIDLDPYQLGLKLNQHPWVGESIVRRILPLGLDIKVVERTPVTYLRSGKDLFLMDKEGWVLESPQNNPSWDLPVTNLPKKQKVDPGIRIKSAVLSNIIELMAVLDGDTTLPLSSISEIDATNPLNIELITIPNGARIKFGYKDFESGLQKLKIVSNTVKTQIGAINYIDLRQLNGVAIKKERRIR